MGTWTVGLVALDSSENELNIYEKFERGEFKLITNQISELEDSILFQADPFLFHYKDSIFLFLETKPVERPAFISVYYLSDDLSEVKFLGISLKEDFHLSYPQVVNLDNEIYLVPESQGAGVSLAYKSSNFPLMWDDPVPFIDDVVKDPTILKLRENGGLVFFGKSGKLFRGEFSYADGKFSVFNKEYLKTGSGFRPVGQPFFVKEINKLLLPLQDNSEGYGYGVNLHEIDSLNLFENIPAKSLFLKRNEFVKQFEGGMHHISHLDLGEIKVFAVDGNFLNSYNRKFNFKYFVKYNYLNLWDYFFGSYIEPWYPFNE